MAVRQFFCNKTGDRATEFFPGAVWTICTDQARNSMFPTLRVIYQTFLLDSTIVSGISPTVAKKSNKAA